MQSGVAVLTYDCQRSFETKRRSGLLRGLRDIDYVWALQNELYGGRQTGSRCGCELIVAGQKSWILGCWFCCICSTKVRKQSAEFRDRALELKLSVFPVSITPFT